MDNENIDENSEEMDATEKSSVASGNADSAETTEERQGQTEPAGGAQDGVAEPGCEEELPSASPEIASHAEQNDEASAVPEMVVEEGEAFPPAEEKLQDVTPKKPAGEYVEDAEEQEEEFQRDEVSEGEEDPLAPAYDLEHGELIEQKSFSARGGALPWSSKVESAKEFFSAELLYRYDLLESKEREEIKGSYRIELKGFQGGIWTLTLGDDLTVVNRREDADVVLLMEQKDFIELVNGKLNPQIAVIGQKVKISGDLRKALSFQTLLVPIGE